MIKWIAQFIVALAFIASPALADGHLFPQRFDVANVASNDTLNIRAQPTGKSNILGELAYDAKGVEVIRKDASGKWGQVNAGEGAGWVSLAYMRVTNDPHWAEMVEPLLCSGTEPFWNLALTPRAEAHFEFFGEPAFKMTPVWESGAFGEPYNVLMRHASKHVDISTLVRAQSCNDGMSDREFGIAVDIFLDTPDDYQNTHYRGCCQLSK